MPTPPDRFLVPGRECGNCNACCVELTIQDPELRKAQGIRCHHARPDNRCGIYDTRPGTCRTFNCGWRRFAWVAPGLRPDQSGILISMGVRSKPGGAKEQVVAFTIMGEGGLAAEGLAESVAAAVAAEIPVFLRVPGPPGYTAAEAEVNPILIDPVQRRDKPGVLKALREAWEQGSGGERVPVFPEDQAS